MFDMCTKSDTAHSGRIFKILPHTHTHTHTHVNMGASVFFTAAMIRAFRSARSRDNIGANIQYVTYPQRKILQGVMSKDLGGP
jgi:hypothetical protein